jgi:DivIVA domain-containing protein
VTLVQILVTLVVVGVVAAVAVGRIPGGLDPAASSMPCDPLPQGPMGADDLRQVVFTQALRGYRMSEVDALLDRLTTQLAAAELAASSTAVSMELTTDSSELPPESTPESAELGVQL